MLAGFRTFAKSPFAILLFGLLIVSFAVFGISDVFKGPTGDWVVSAGSRSMSSQDFKARFDNYRKDAEQRGGEPITPELAVQRGLDRQILNELALQESIAELIRKVGVRPSDKLVADIVRQQMAQLPPNLRPFDPITGKFDSNMYAALLAQNNLTPATYEASLRDEIAQTHFFSGGANGLRAPRIYSALQAAYGLESRDLAAFALSPASVPQPAAPTDAQLQAFMKENAAQLTLPEFRVLSVVRFSAQALEPTVTVDPAEVRKTFDFRKDTLGAAETRSLVQIVAPDARAAQTIAQRLTAGEAPAAVAKAYGKEPVIIADKPKTALPDRKVADAAFALAAGQVSAPIAGDLGVSVVKVTKITPGKAADFEAARPAIEAELRAEAAQAKAYDQTQVYDDAHNGGDDLLAAGAKAGAVVVTTAPIAAQGVDQTGQPAPGLTPDMVKTAFGLPVGGESEITEAAKGEYYAVRVERIIPAALPPLAQVRPQLAQAWMMNEMVRRLQAKADELAARVRKGESLEAVAASVGSTVQRAAGVSRENAQTQYQGLGREVLVALFGAKSGEVFAARAAQFGFVVGKLEAVRPGEVGQMARVTEAQRQQTTMGLFRDLGEAARAAARAELKTKVNLDRARQALGVDPSQVPKGDGAAPGKAP